MIETLFLNFRDKTALLRRKYNWAFETEKLAHTNTCKITHGLVVANVQEKQGTMLVSALALQNSRSRKLQAAWKVVKPDIKILAELRPLGIFNPWQLCLIKTFDDTGLLVIV